LGAEIEFTVDNQTYNITKSFLAYIPPGVQHGPLIIKNVKRPIMHYTAGPTAKYE
jgi:quercetin dioxygenase-like cupin family protein